MAAIDKPHQTDAIRQHLMTRYSFNCHEMGLGKTLTALRCFDESSVRNLCVVCPAYLIPNWKDEVTKFFGTKLDGRITYLSYASRAKIPTDTNFLILDEFHYVKNPKAKRTNKIYSFLSKHRPEYFIGLSGTPMKRDASDFFSYLMMLKLHHSNLHFPMPYYAFQATYCRKVENNFTPSGYTYEGVNEQRVPELRALLRPYFYYKRTKDVIDLPDTVDKKYFSKQKNKHDDLLMKALDEGRSQEFMAIKALNAEENTKLTITLITELIDQGKRPVVFTEHRASALLLAQAFGTTAVIGGVSSDKRHDIVAAFENNKKNVIIGTFGAMSAGINLVSSDTMVFNDYSFIPADYLQARKRIHRMGQSRQCFYHHVFSSDMDFGIFNRLVGKMKDIQEVEGEGN